MSVGEMTVSLIPFYDRSKWTIESAYSFAWRDEYPVSRGHMLVIPKRYVTSIFELSTNELTDIMELVCSVRRKIIDEFNPQGFNVGVNDGRAAGQTVMHAHIHIIPRYDGDHPDPRGGIRGVIPAMKVY
jgi:diadenosine tetraphosphate (Ap4A) HIT family hydrolase